MNISRTSFRKPLLASALALAGLGLAGQANAAAVAYSSIQLLEFQFSVVGGSVEADPNAREVSASASYNGSGPTTNQKVTSPSDANTVQATAGPGPFPSENNFSNTLTAGMVGGRGDAATTTTSGLLSVQNVGEARIVSGGTASGGSAYNKNSATITVGTGATLTLGFDALLKRYASTDVAGETASSATTASFSVKNNSTGVEYSMSDVGSSVTNKSDFLFLTGTDSSSNGGTLANVFNTYAVSGTAAGNQYFVWTQALTAGTWTLSLNVSDNSSAAKAVPEPATMSLLGAGLVGLAAARRRKAKAKAEAEIQA